MGLFTTNALPIRVAIGRPWMTSEKKVLKVIQSNINLSKEEKVFLKVTLGRSRVSIFVSLKEYTKLVKVADKTELISVDRLEYQDREEGTDRRIR